MHQLRDLLPDAFTAILDAAWDPDRGGALPFERPAWVPPADDWRLPGPEGDPDGPGPAEGREAS